MAVWSQSGRRWFALDPQTTLLHFDGVHWVHTGVLGPENQVQKQESSQDVMIAGCGNMDELQGVAKKAEAGDGCLFL